MNLFELENELNSIYKFDEFEDFCKNGIQVEGKKEVNRIILGVTITKDLIEHSIINNADAIIVHHGIFGKNFFELKGTLKSRIKLLLGKNISLIAIHLPMDAQPGIGHNKVIADIIGLDNLKSFNFGFSGDNVEKLSIENINIKIIDYLKKSSGNSLNLKNIKIIDYLKSIPNKITIISGDSYKYFEQAISEGTDLFICGTINEYIPPIAKENGKSIIALGHYNSETPGIIKLAQVLNEKLNLNASCCFFENEL